ncbi:MAG TPA: YcxB family protein, partial [Tepidisphaeraceae bacterium]|nr:YcxB family protein [Tepidisphaeraceae bacterium]
PATPPIIPPPGQSMWATFLVPMAPWLLIFAIVWVFIFVQVRMRSAKAAWEKYPSLQLRRRLDADPARFVIDDTQSRTELTWPAVKHFVETPNLFLLYVESDTFHIIPKRAFAGGGGGAGGNAGGGSDGNVDSFRELLRANVQPATRAFPVQPVRPT